MKIGVAEGIYYRIRHKETRGGFISKESGVEKDELIEKTGKSGLRKFKAMLFDHNETPQRSREDNPMAVHFFNHDFFEKHSAILNEVVSEFNQYEVLVVDAKDLEIHFCDEAQVLATFKED